MAKKLLIKTPQTTDGTTLRYDDNSQVVYKNSILELGARKNILNLNAKLPKHLQHVIEEVEIDDQPIGSSNDELRKKLANLEAQQENDELKKRIAELEAKLSTGTSEPNANAESKVETVASLATKIKEAETIDEVNVIAGTDERKGVVEAAKKRIAELEANQ